MVTNKTPSEEELVLSLGAACMGSIFGVHHAFLVLPGPLATWSADRADPACGRAVIDSSLDPSKELALVANSCDQRKLWFLREFESLEEPASIATPTSKPGRLPCSGELWCQFSQLPIRMTSWEGHSLSQFWRLKPQGTGRAVLPPEALGEDPSCLFLLLGAPGIPWLWKLWSSFLSSCSISPLFRLL